MGGGQGVLLMVICGSQAGGAGQQGTVGQGGVRAGGCWARMAMVQDCKAEYRARQGTGQGRARGQGRAAVRGRVEGPEVKN